MTSAKERKKAVKNSCSARRRMVILSFDAVGERDIRKHLGQMPNFKRLMESGAYCGHVQSVYPSLTYPAHTSIITGKMPVHHGIVNNTLLQPGVSNPEWCSDYKLIQGTTLYTEAGKRGDRVCALMWPVTGHGPIAYNLPEIHAVKRGQNQIIETLKNGSFFYMLPMLPYATGLIKGVREPQLDDFLHKVLLKTIYRYNPELLLVHFLDVDNHRHQLGLDHPEITRALMRLDRKLGEILTALSKTRAGVCHSMEETTIVVLGDHCQKNCDTVFYPNYFLKKHGLLRTQNGEVVDYQVIAKNCDGSCYLYLHPDVERNPNLRQEVTKKLTELFTGLSQQKNSAISKVFTGEQAGAMGADDKCVMMLEAKEGYYFLDDAKVLTRKVEQIRQHRMFATHGYLPDLPDYETFLMMSGYGVKKGVEVERTIRLWDEAPTFAKLMGLTLPDTDGHVIEEMLLVP